MTHTEADSLIDRAGKERVKGDAASTTVFSEWLRARGVLCQRKHEPLRTADTTSLIRHCQGDEQAENNNETTPGWGEALSSVAII